MSFKLEIPGAFHNDSSILLLILHTADGIFVKGGLQSMRIYTANLGQILFFFGGRCTVDLDHARLSFGA